MKTTCLFLAATTFLSSAIPLAAAPSERDLLITRSRNGILTVIRDLRKETCDEMRLRLLQLPVGESEVSARADAEISRQMNYLNQFRVYYECKKDPNASCEDPGKISPAAPQNANDIVQAFCVKE